MLSGSVLPSKDLPTAATSRGLLLLAGPLQRIPGVPTSSQALCHSLPFTQQSGDSYENNENGTHVLTQPEPSIAERSVSLTTAWNTWLLPSGARALTPDLPATLGPAPGLHYQAFCTQVPTMRLSTCSSLYCGHVGSLVTLNLGP